MILNKEPKEIIAIIGGTGKEGKGLAYRWAKAGYPVIIGSRSEEKAQAAVNELKELLSISQASDTSIEGKTNQEAVNLCGIAVLTVPYEFHEAILKELKPFFAGEILAGCYRSACSSKSLNCSNTSSRKCGNAGANDPGRRS